MKNISNSLLWITILLLVAIFSELGCILIFNRGVFTYTLDDPYIHLSLAENILKLHYGINLEEFSSPSSSIIWPFFLAPFTILPKAHWIPLLLNICFAFITLFVLSKIFEVLFKDAEQKVRKYLEVILLIIFILATNVVGLIFTGMEHTLQVLSVAMIFYLVVIEMQDQKVPFWGIAVLIAAPLIRYENFAVSIPVALYLFLRGYRLKMIAFAVFLAMFAGGFSIFLIQLGLPALPQSVIAKGGSLGSINPWQRIIYMMQNDRMILMAVIMIFFGFLSLLTKFKKEERIFARCASLSLLLHLTYGQYGWYARYEIYMWVFALLTLMYLLREYIIDAVIHSKKSFTAVLIVSIVLLCQPYLNVFTTLPYAANNIFDEHYHMHQYVTEYYKRPVAVNDIGYVSYNNDNFVLDIAGLSSKDAFDARMKAPYGNVSWMDSLAKIHNVQLAMIYETWYPTQPPNWKKIGELYLTRDQIIVGGPIVSFFTLNDSIRPEVKKQLLEFEPTLPFKRMLLIYD
jgi:hypothetical protein